MPPVPGAEHAFVYGRGRKRRPYYVKGAGQAADEFRPRKRPVPGVSSGAE
ncbi:hypothetical protein GCM10023196_100010 [Actinoallomurus vinaceus]|uniref:Uncharacterized protein n=1 Tax=Actinoallomurus vinaceus TaxID=1080074 RepID=A0ABP8USR2_9ACTN